MSYGRTPQRASWDQLSSDGDHSAGDDTEDFARRPRPLQYPSGTPVGYATNKRASLMAEHSDYSASATQLSFDRNEIPDEEEVQQINSNFHNSMPSLGVGIGINAADESSLLWNMAPRSAIRDNHQPVHRREIAAPQLPPPRAGRAIKPPNTTEEPPAPAPRRSNRFKFPATRKADVVVGRQTDIRHADPNATTIICDHCNATMQVPPSGFSALVVFCSRCKNVTPTLPSPGDHQLPKHFATTSFASFAP